MTGLISQLAWICVSPAMPYVCRWLKLASDNTNIWIFRSPRRPQRIYAKDARLIQSNIHCLAPLQILSIQFRTRSINQLTANLDHMLGQITSDAFSPIQQSRCPNSSKTSRSYCPSSNLSLRTVYDLSVASSVCTLSILPSGKEDNRDVLQTIQIRLRCECNGIIDYIVAIEMEHLAVGPDLSKS